MPPSSPVESPGHSGPDPVPAAAVREQLSRVVNSPKFVSSARLCRFLSHIVNRAIDGDLDNLKEFTIAMEVFDRTSDYDPNIDAIVRVEARRLRAKLKAYYEDGPGTADPVLIALRPGSYVPIFRRLDSRQPSDRLEIGAAIRPGRASVAVLPFVNMSPEPEQDYFCDGITEEIVNSLTRVSGLNVIARTSAFQFKGVSVDIREVGQRLGADLVIEGSVRKSGEHLRITAQAIQTESGHHLWSETFRRELKDVFVIQEEIAQSVADLLRLNMPAAQASVRSSARNLEPAHICNPLRKLLRHVTVLSAEIKAIDLAARQVTISYGIRALTRELPFDHLVLALGSETDYFGIPGVAEHALGIKTLGDAVMLRAGVIAMLEAASVEPDPDRRKRMLTFVVAGGGFAGVETVGAINDLARESLPHYGRVDPREVRVVLIGGKAILPELGEALGLYAHERLRRRHVEIKLGVKVNAYAEGAVHCSDGEVIPAEMLVWAAGVSPSLILNDIPCELQKGRVAVSSTLEVPGAPGVWAVGDCALIIDPTSKLPYPPTAQHALREGRRAGENIYARLRGKELKLFRYKMLGQLATIGRRTGVAKMFGFKFSGALGWLLWRTVYLMKLPRFEKKLRVGLQWALDVVFARDLGQYLTPRDVGSLNRLLETTRHEDFAATRQHDRSRRIA